MVQAARNGLTMQYGYNGQGQLTELTDEKGGVTQLSYNDQNWLAEVINPTGEYRDLVYSYQADFTEVRISSYSADGTLLSRNIQRNDPLSGDALKEYLSTTSEQVSQFEYNTFDDLTSSIVYGPFGDTSTTTTSTIQYSYDEIGRLIKIGLDGVGHTTRYS